MHTQTVYIYYQNKDTKLFIPQSVRQLTDVKTTAQTGVAPGVGDLCQVRSMVEPSGLCAIETRLVLSADTVNFYMFNK